jgi:hypothetical protein
MSRPRWDDAGRAHQGEVLGGGRHPAMGQQRLSILGSGRRRTVKREDLGRPAGKTPHREYSGKGQMPTERLALTYKPTPAWAGKGTRRSLRSPAQAWRAGTQSGDVTTACATQRPRGFSSGDSVAGVRSSCLMQSHHTPRPRFYLLLGGGVEIQLDLPDIRGIAP